MSNDALEQKNGHGGARVGAGRRTRYEKTVVMRVPEQYRDVIKGLIEHLDASEMIDKNYTPEESKSFFIRSLQDKPQQVSFRVSPINSAGK